MHMRFQMHYFLQMLNSEGKVQVIADLSSKVFFQMTNENISVILYEFRLYDSGIYIYI